VQRLVRDEASAQDVLQSTWLRALRHPPRAERGSPGWRSWFARVARNLALRERERASARRERELRSARGERLPSTHEIAEREELRARIVAHVLALPEPYRSTLVLRYYEGLEPRAIAREQHVEGSTVRNRIARGLALLRERLERERGKDWVSCCLAVLPLGSAKLLAAHAGWVGWLAKGGIVVKKIEIATAAAVVLTAGAVWFAWPSKSGSQALQQADSGPVALSKEGSAVALPSAGGVQDSPLDAEAATGARASAQQRKPADAAELAAAGAGVRVFGHVRDAHGEPIQNSGGRFRMQLGGGMVSADVPVLEFHSTGEEPQQTQGVQLELSLQMEETKAVEDAHEALDRDDARAVEVQRSQDLVQSMDELRADQLSKVFSRLMLLGSTRIVFADSEGCQFTGNANTDSSYSVDGLHAGKWHTIVTHDGKLCRRQEFEIPAGEHQHLLDLTLDDALAVRVKLRTPDGLELGAAIAADPELSVHVALSPVALRPGSAARYLPDGDNQNYGCGSYQPRAQLDEQRRGEIGEASGVLTITEAPPLEVGLVMCGQLIARRPLAPGQEEVEFVLSLEDLRHFFATVVVHVVDAQTQAPIAGASVSIDGVRTLVDAPSAADASPALRTAIGERLERRKRELELPRANDDRAAAEERAVEDVRAAAQGLQTDAQGVARIPWVMPGKRRVFVAAQSYSAFSGRLEIEGGGTCELRAIELTGHARISGRVFDPEGKPAQARLQLVPLDRFDEAREDLAGSVWESSENGAFEIPHQRRERYVLRAAEGENMLLPIAVDTTQGDVGDVELRLVAPGQVQLNLTREPKEGAELRITTAAGLPVLERDLSGLAPIQLSLAPGAYLAEVREGAHKSGSLRFVAGKDALRAVLTLD
jgi:RNA polymerase sigma-70 factor (ECF subfamily)